MENQDALLRQAIAGDCEALVALLNLHSAGLRRSLAGRIPRRWAGVLSEDDLLQQTYTDAVLHIAEFAPAGPGALEAWLRTMARNNLIDAVRALECAKRGGDRVRVDTPQTPGASTTPGHPLEPGTHTTPSLVLARAEAGDLLRGACGRLPEAQRRVVQMYDLEGRAMAEVAAALGRSPGACYLLRLRALARLRDLLGARSTAFHNLS